MQYHFVVYKTADQLLNVNRSKIIFFCRLTELKEENAMLKLERDHLEKALMGANKRIQELQTPVKLFLFYFSKLLGRLFIS